MNAAWSVELLKTRRSRVIAVTTGLLLIVPPSMASAFVHAAARPGLDPMSVKARALIVGTGWEGYLSAVVHVYASAGLLGMGIAVAWCFGREHADRTVVSLYASVTSRGQVAVAKLAVLTAWEVGIAAALVPSTLAIGLATELGRPDAAAVEGLGRLTVLTVLTVLTGLLVAAQVAVVVGIGGWFPLSTPGVWAMHGTDMPAVRISQLAMVPVVALVAAGGTVVWWRRLPLV